MKVKAMLDFYTTQLRECSHLSEKLEGFGRKFKLLRANAELSTKLVKARPICAGGSIRCGICGAENLSHLSNLCYPLVKRASEDALETEAEHRTLRAVARKGIRRGQRVTH